MHEQESKIVKQNVLQRAFNHAAAQPFISATGFAALVHSTWALGTLLSGTQPQPPAASADVTLQLIFLVQTLAWHVPAFAIAFALDVGQIVTSHEIAVKVQAGESAGRKYITFAVFAVFTYYLQWLYCAHHMPLLNLGAGISPAHAQTARDLRDAAVWVIPALLPLSTFMYTFSQSAASERAPRRFWSVFTIFAPQRAQAPAEHAVVVERPVRSSAPALPAKAAPRSNPAGNYTGEAKDNIVHKNNMHIFTCPKCLKEVEYDNPLSAEKGAAAHKRYCKGAQESEVPVELEQSS